MSGVAFNGTMFEHVQQLHVSIQQRTAPARPVWNRSHASLPDLCITPTADFLALQETVAGPVASGRESGRLCGRASSVSPASMSHSQRRPESPPGSNALSEDEADHRSRPTSPIRMTNQPPGPSAASSKRLRFKDLLQDLLVHGECAMAYHSLAHGSQRTIGVLFQNIKLRANTLYQLHLGFEIERDEDTIAPQLLVRASNSVHRWKKEFALSLTQHQSGWTARFYVPSRVYAMTLELVFDSHSLFVQERCRFVLQPSVCYLVPVPETSNLERVWTAPAYNSSSSSSSSSIREENAGDGQGIANLPGRSNLHELFAGVYILRHPDTDWASSRRFQNHLAQHGVQFHFIDVGSDAANRSASGSIFQCGSIDGSCQRCFYLQATGSWMDLNASLHQPPSATRRHHDAQQVASCLHHAIRARYHSILILSDVASVRIDWNDDVLSHRSQIPSAWKVILLSSALPVGAQSDVKLTTGTEWQNVPFMCADLPLADADTHRVATGINGGVDVYRKLLAQVEQLQLEATTFTLDQWIRDALLTETNHGRVWHWMPSLFGEGGVSPRYWSPASEFQHGCSVSMITGRPLIRVLLPIESRQLQRLETPGEKLRCVKRCLDAYRKQTLQDWSLTVFLAKDTMASVLTHAILQEWIAGDLRIQVQWVMREQDLLASVQLHLARWSNTANDASQPWVVGRLPYLPLPRQLERLVDLTRAQNDASLFHCGPSGTMTCAPCPVLEHSFCGPIDVLVRALDSITAWEQLRSRVQTPPVVELAEVLSCLDRFSAGRS